MNICNIAWLLYILRKEVLKLVDRKIIYFEDKEYPLELKRLNNHHNNYMLLEIQNY